MRPDVTQLFDWAVDRRRPLIFDAQSLVTGDLADLLCRHLILSRSLENASNQTRLHRNDRPRPTLAKERKLRRVRIIERDFRRQRLHFWPPTRRRKARLRNRDRNPTIANIMRRLHAS